MLISCWSHYYLFRVIIYFSVQDEQMYYTLLKRWNYFKSLSGCQLLLSDEKQLVIILESENNLIKKLVWRRKKG
jgi:hypothetical protein